MEYSKLKKITITGLNIMIASFICAFLFACIAKNNESVIAWVVRIIIMSSALIGCIMCAFGLFKRVNQVYKEEVEKIKNQYK